MIIVPYDGVGLIGKSRKRAIIVDMDEENIAGIIDAQADESFKLEYKSALKWESNHDDIGWLQAHVIKAILGFTNTEGGGLIILGVKDDSKGSRTYTGLTSEQLESFRNTELLQETIDRYADSPLSYSAKFITYKKDDVEQTYIAIEVNEFQLNPVLCARDVTITKDNGEKEIILRKHDLYARARKGRFGTTKATGLELQSVVALAHTKAEERIIQLFSSVTSSPLLGATESSPYTELDGDL